MPRMRELLLAQEVPYLDLARRADRGKFARQRRVRLKAVLGLLAMLQGRVRCCG
jgi:hypothetical protein